MDCDDTPISCALREIVRVLGEQSAWDGFWPTVLATALGAVFAAVFSYLFYRAEQKRRDKQEKLAAISSTIQSLAVLADSLISRSEKAFDAALHAHGEALVRLRLLLRDDEEIVAKYVARETLFWIRLPIDELSNRSQAIREELLQWAKGKLSLEHIERQFNELGDSGQEHLETPETIPAQLHNVNRGPSPTTPAASSATPDEEQT